MSTHPISTLLVANRGEIANRVLRTARAMGMRCVAVYVEADRDAPFVTDADEAIRLDGGYGDSSAILTAARDSGADAIHPGYGFLSENPEFATAVIAAGIKWVGPSPAVIRAMGDKLAAKRAAVAADVPTLPSTEDVEDAAHVGYPLLVKAAAGGGGKGMRIVDDAASLDQLVAAARREAASGFGDDRVFLERYLARARHIEIQILGDRHGTLVHLGERECSIQRRHQKIIEEAPSPVVDDDMRARMGQAALALAGELGYESAGTVEFLVDEATRDFYFLEVNTRLQVEHPVTEAVTGFDIVREQLRIASGEPLGYGQNAITISGHAVEARLYAEDPAAGFLPATGTLTAFEPASQPVVRWDSGVQPGSVVGLDFDPMLAKVIAHAPTRTEAASRLALALERLHIGGVTTNARFLAATLRHPAFQAGDTTTDFIDRVDPAASLELDAADVRRAAVAAAMWLRGLARRDARVLAGLPGDWRNARLPPQRADFRLGGLSARVSYRTTRSGRVDLGDGSSARVYGWTEREVDVEIDGHRGTTRVTPAGELIHVQSTSGTITFELVPRFPVTHPETRAGGLVAPMPGVATDVRVGVGDSVHAKQVLVVLEAMKMEHHITAPIDGIVREVRVHSGAQVGNGDLLLVLEKPAQTGEMGP